GCVAGESERGHLGRNARATECLAAACGPKCHFPSSSAPGSYTAPTARTELPLGPRGGITPPPPARSSDRKEWRREHLSPASHRDSDGDNGEGRSGTEKSGCSCNSS